MYLRLMTTAGRGGLRSLAIFDPSFVSHIAAFLGFALVSRNFTVLVKFFFHEARARFDLFGVDFTPQTRNFLSGYRRIPSCRARKLGRTLKKPLLRDGTNSEKP